MITNWSTLGLTTLRKVYQQHNACHLPGEYPTAMSNRPKSSQKRLRRQQSQTQASQNMMYASAPCPAQVDVKFYHRVGRLAQDSEKFGPSWFSVTMGTGIVSLLFAAIPFKAQWLYWLAVILLD
jgi:hypothetical protein